MLSLGLGVFLILTLYLVQRTLLVELASDRAGTGANIVLFDIQSDQKTALVDLLHSQKLVVLDEAPIVTMRISSIKGRSVEEMLGDKNKQVPNWVLRREYRSSYRERLRGGESIAAGKWTGEWSPKGSPKPKVQSPKSEETQPQDRSHEAAESPKPVGQGQTSPTLDIGHWTLDSSPVPVSVEEGIAKEMGVGLGDKLVLDVQGVPLTAQVVSLRHVDWHRAEPNFFLLFPRGALEEAPATHVVLTRADSPETSARLQKAVVQAFPNVTAIDLTMVLQTLDGIIGKISFAIQFMALFTVLTGVLVLAGAILTGRYQRMRESILLRMLGASRAQILQIQIVEYACLGFMAALTGVILAVAASWALGTFVFHLRFVLFTTPLVVGLLSVLLLTVGMGMLMGRGIAKRPPLELLRAE